MATPTCESCGAGIEPSQLACPFCKAVTPFGLRHREDDERARRAQDAANAAISQRNDAQARALAEAELGRLGRLSATWSAIGFVFCCAPVPSIVSLVLAYRARVVARENKFVLPAQATIGFLLSVVTLLLSVSFYSFAGVSAVQKQRRISALESATASKATAETLDHDTACALIELHLLSHGFTSTSDSIDKLTCEGALEQHGSTATVRDVTFEVSTAFHTTEASFRRGERWIVEGVKERGGEAPSAPASGKGSAAVGHEPPAPHAAPGAPTHHGEPGGAAPKGATAAGHAGPGH